MSVSLFYASLLGLGGTKGKTSRIRPSNTDATDLRHSTGGYAVSAGKTFKIPQSVTTCHRHQSGLGRMKGKTSRTIRPSASVSDDQLLTRMEVVTQHRRQDIQGTTNCDDLLWTPIFFFVVHSDRNSGSSDMCCCTLAPPPTES